MKQNIYDDPDFFNGYLQLRTTKSGFNEILEEPAMNSLFPELLDCHVLDIGCGFGKYCRKFAVMGASSIIGIDISKNMISLAEQDNSEDRIKYYNISLEDSAFEKDSFDLITSSLTLHYIENYSEAVSKIVRWLKPGGSLIFSVEHPIATAIAQQKWIVDEKTNNKYWPVDDYAMEGPRATKWFVDNVIKYHRTVSTYVNELVLQGLAIQHLGEPVPATTIATTREDIGLFWKRPALLIISAQKR